MQPESRTQGGIPVGIFEVPAEDDLPLSVGGQEGERKVCGSLPRDFKDLEGGNPRLTDITVDSHQN